MKIDSAPVMRPVDPPRLLPLQQHDVIGEPDNVNVISELEAENVRNDILRREGKFTEINRQLQEYASRYKDGTLGLDKDSAAKAAASRKQLEETLTETALKAFYQSAGESGERFDYDQAKAAVDAAIKQASMPFKQDAGEAVGDAIKSLEKDVDLISQLHFQFEAEKALLDAQTEEIPSSKTLVDLGQVIIDTIEGIKNGYMEVFLQATEKLNKFFEAFEAIRALLHTHLGGPENNKQPFHVQDLLKKFKKLLDDFNNKNAQLFPLPDKDGNYATTTKTIAENWIAQLGLSEGSLSEDPAGSGKYRVKIDFGPINNIIDSLNGFGTSDKEPTYWVDPARYGAWESGFNAQVAMLQSNIEILMQKSNNANSGFNRNHEMLKKYFDDMLSLAIQILRA